MTRWPDHRILRSYRCAPLLWLVSFVCCTTLRSPLEIPRFKAEEVTRAEESGIVLEVKPVDDQASNVELFDDDLPALGIAPVWVSLRNTLPNDIDPGQFRYRLQVGSHRSKQMSTSELFERYYKARGIRMYTLNTDRNARLAIERVALERGTLVSGNRQQGFVFFRIDPATARTWAHQATFLLENLRLAGGKPRSIRIRLSHAQP